MRYLLLLIFLSGSYLKGICQAGDHKIIYLKIIEAVTAEYKWRKDIILIYDSTSNWTAKENYSLLSLIRKRQKLKTKEWDSVMQNFDLCPQAEPINKYFNLPDIPKVAGVKFIYETQKVAGTDAFGYWRISFSPLYFNDDHTKCLAVADFLVGMCGNGAKRILFFQKNKEGVWLKAKRLFME